jgi:putative Holliday junction resolvase
MTVLGILVVLTHLAGGWMDGGRPVKVLALDIGSVRIGVATSDETELLASPYGMVRRRSAQDSLVAILRTVEETQAGLVVVGLPVSFDGTLHAQAKSVQAFAEKLRKRLSVPLVYADETLSTVRAEEKLRASGVRSDRMAERIDAAAAAVILQDYLDARRQTSPGTLPSFAGNEEDNAPS